MTAINDETADTLVSIDQASRWFGIPRHTIASWIRRKRVEPTGRRNRAKLYSLARLTEIERETRTSKYNHRQA